MTNNEDTQNNETVSRRSKYTTLATNYYTASSIYLLVDMNPDTPAVKTPSRSVPPVPPHSSLLLMILSPAAPNY
jgi:hypothetical protein